MRACLGLVVLCMAIAACGEDPPETDPAIPEGYERVTGSERLAWDAEASNAQELATYRYLAHIDDAAGVDLQNVSCAGAAGPAGFPCAAALPSLTAGRHTIRISSYLDSGGTRLESSRSEPLNVFKVIEGGSGLSSRTTSIALTTTDGVELVAQVVADDLEEPVDLAFAPDGSIFIAERAGRISVWRAGHLIPEPAVTLADAATAGGGGLLAIAIDPQFERTRFLYVAYTADKGFRLARLRAVGSTLGDRAILLDGILSSPVSPSASLRFGPDGRLYLSLDDAGDPQRSGDLGSFNGKTLRLTADATTPLDPGTSSPIYAANLSAPRGAAWDPSGATLWLLDRSVEGPTYLQVVNALSDVVGGAGRGAVVARYALPDRAVGSALAFYLSDVVPELRGNLLAAQEGVRADASILRIVFDPNDLRTVLRTERLLHGSIDGAGALGVSPGGIIYLGTRRALLSLTPARAR